MPTSWLNRAILREISAPRRAGRYLAVASIILGALAFMLTMEPFAGLAAKAIGSSPSGPTGIGGLLGLAAIAAGMAGLFIVGRKASIYTSLAVIGLLAGVVALLEAILTGLGGFGE